MKYLAIRASWIVLLGGCNSILGIGALGSAADAPGSRDAAAIDAIGVDAPPGCGDHVVQPPETCDDGIANDDDLGPCSHACQPIVRWTRTVPGVSGNDSIAIAIAADPLGDLWIGGVQNDAANTPRMWIQKVTAEGAEISTRVGTTDAVAIHIATTTDAVVIAGSENFTAGPDGWNGWVEKRTLDDQLVWRRDYKPTSTGCEFLGVATDVSGNIAVAGYEDVAGESRNVFVRKYDRDGGELWTRTYATPAEEGARGVAIAPSGDVVVVGSQVTATQQYNVIIRSYDAAGELNWTSSYDGGASEPDEGEAVAISSIGDVAAVGVSSPAAATNALWTRVLDKDGDPLWTRNATPMPGGNWANATAIDEQSNIYVAGYASTGDNGTLLWLRKYDQHGNVIWTRSQAGLAKSYNSIKGIVVDATGEVTAVGFVAVAGGGRQLWMRGYGP